jgi:hypothetical protein
VLPGWLFDAETHEASFTFLGSVLVTYVNPAHVDTWTATPVRAEVTLAADQRVVAVASGVLGAEWAQKVRGGAVAAVRLFFQ